MVNIEAIMLIVFAKKNKKCGSSLTQSALVVHFVYDINSDVLNLLLDFVNFNLLRQDKSVKEIFSFLFLKVQSSEGEGS